MGRIQNEDIKTLTEITAGGGNMSQLPNASKVYIAALNKTLEQAIIDQDILTINSFYEIYKAIVGSPAQVASGIASHSSIQAVNDDVAVTAGSQVLLLKGTYTGAVNLTKRLSYVGQGRDTEINGVVTIAAGFNFGQIKDLRFAGNVTLDAATNGIIIMPFWRANTAVITDNSAPGSNLIIGIGE